VYSKGNVADTMEEEGHLYYSYLPQYQRDRWFEVRDKSDRKESRTIEAVEQKKKGRSLRRPTKNKYMFAYLENGLKTGRK
jgi:hypothetical protein